MSMNRKNSDTTLLNSLASDKSNKTESLLDSLASDESNKTDSLLDSLASDEKSNKTESLQGSVDQANDSVEVLPYGEVLHSDEDGDIEGWDEWSIRQQSWLTRLSQLNQGARSILVGEESHQYEGAMRLVEILIHIRWYIETHEESNKGWESLFQTILSIDPNVMTQMYHLTITPAPDHHQFKELLEKWKRDLSSVQLVVPLVFFLILPIMSMQGEMNNSRALQRVLSVFSEIVQGLNQKEVERLNWIINQLDPSDSFRVEQI